MSHFKKVKNRLERMRAIFFQMGLIISGGLVLLAFEWTFSTQLSDLGGEIIYEEEWESDLGSFDVIEEEVEKKEVKQESKPEPIKALEKFEKVADDFKDKVTKIESKDVGDNAGLNDNDRKIITKGNKKSVNKKEKIVLIPEVNASFVGGMEKLFKYLGKNIKYPTRARDAGIEGKVYLTFVVNKKGEIKDVKILKGVNDLIDAEAIRVVSAMPNWNPGLQGGKSVSVRYNLPISFTLR